MLPGWTAFLVVQPGASDRTSIGSELFCPNGSVDSPPIGQNGTPSLKDSNPPMPHPLAIHPAGPPKDLGVGMSYNQLKVRFRVMLKSDNPLVIAPSHQGVAAVGLDE